MSDTEVAIKSEHLKSIRAEIDKLESEKAAITDWRIREEKKVDAAKAEAKRVSEEVGAKKNELLAEQKKTADLINDLKRLEESIARQRGEIQYELARLDEERKQNLETNKALYGRQDFLAMREADLVKREEFIKGVFEGIEKLKG